MHRNFLVIFFILSNLSVYSRIKIACVGDSITFGATIKEISWLSYPSQLQKMLGDKYEIQNWGFGGCTLLQKGNRTYINSWRHKKILAWEPNIVIINLGANDSKPKNWAHKAEFKDDMKTLVQSFQSLPSKPKIYIGLTVPVEGDKYSITEKTVAGEVIPMVIEVAKELKLPTINFYKSVAVGKGLFSDGVHPNAKGAHQMAKIVYKTLTSKPYSVGWEKFKGSTLANFPPLWNLKNGYLSRVFMHSRLSINLLEPKKPAKGKPWVLRTRFMGKKPKSDYELLKKGYHIIYCQIANLLGSPESVTRMNEFYNYVTTSHGFSRKPALAGMRDDGLILLKWAAENTSKVSSIYLETPVCDFKSWPVFPRL